MLARFFAPAGAVALAILVLAWTWDRRHPMENPNVAERVIVAEQIERARTMGPADILILGDSSALMGVDAGRLGQLLGRRVESLATLAWVGPAGYARLLSEYSSRTPVPVLVFLFNPVALLITDAAFQKFGYEREVLGTPQRLGASFLEAARYSLYVHVIMRLVVLPLPGLYGREYGWPPRLGARLREHHGSLVDPNIFKDEPAAAAFVIGQPFARRLPLLRDAIVAARARNVYLALTPIPSTGVSPDVDASRLAASTSIATQLGLSAKDALLPLPTSLPSEMFAVSTHLAAAGQIRYTETLADVLGARLGIQR